MRDGVMYEQSGEWKPEEVMGHFYISSLYHRLCTHHKATKP